MSKTLRLALVLIISALALLVLSVLAVNRQVEARLNTTYQLASIALDIPSDAAAVERGQHLVSAVYLCMLCHGDNLGGLPHFNDPLSGQIAASNLTVGAGGIGADYTPTDWERAIRHGVGPDGLPLVEMPSHAYAHIGDADLGAIIAYIRGLPPVDNPLPERQVGPLYILSILSDPSLIPAEVIDHHTPAPRAPSPAVSAEYGGYLARACTICHGEDFAGRRGAGAGLDLTPSGDLPNWSQADFIRALRTGLTPRGYTLDPDLMPWKIVGQMSDEELSAIWLYLNQLEPQGAGE